MYGQGPKQAKSSEKEKESHRSIMATISTMPEEEIIARLKVLENDPTMKSESIYSPAATEWPDSKLPLSNAIWPICAPTRLLIQNIIFQT